MDLFNNYMDNLKSPYWEVIISIIIIAVSIGGTGIIFIDSEGLGSKLGNTGSFLGGLFTIIGVIVAFFAYHTGKLEHKKQLLFKLKSELEIEILPEIADRKVDIVKNSISILTKIRKGDVLNDTDKETVFKLIRDTEYVVKIISIKTTYLKKLGALQEQHYEKLTTFTYLMENIGLLLDIIEIYMEGESISEFEKDLESLNGNSEFFNRYFIKGTRANKLNFNKQVVMIMSIFEIVDGLKEYYGLDSNQI